MRKALGDWNCLNPGPTLSSRILIYETNKVFRANSSHVHILWRFAFPQSYCIFIIKISLHASLQTCTYI